MYGVEETFKVLEEQRELIRKAFKKVLGIKDNNGLIYLKDFKSPCHLVHVFFISSLEKLSYAVSIINPI